MNTDDGPGAETGDAEVIERSASEPAAADGATATDTVDTLVEGTPVKGTSLADASAGSEPLFPEPAASETTTLVTEPGPADPEAAPEPDPAPTPHSEPAPAPESEPAPAPEPAPEALNTEGSGSEVSDPEASDPASETAPEEPSAPEPAIAPPPTDPTPTDALAWIDLEQLAAAATGPVVIDAGSKALLADAPRRTLARPGVLVPISGLLLVAVAYGATMAAWPLTAVQPTASAVTFRPSAAPSAAVSWPTAGSAAVGIEGIGVIASAEQQSPMASITKLVTVLAALEKMPLQPGEQGPAFDFTQADSDTYWSYLRADESALDVPVGGSLTEYQLLEGILLGSANNYADRLAREVWGADQNYADAANQWLRQHDLTDIAVVTPSGFDFGNVATPRALIRLGEIAVHNPVIAGIVKQKSVDLPGAGTVENTNGLIDDAGIIGIKTGTIGDGDATVYNLLSAKEVTDGDTTVRIYVAVLGEPSDEARIDASRKLYADVEAALKEQPQTVGKGATLGTVDTAWGETTQVVATSDARVVLWNGASAAATTKFSIGDEWKAGDKAGTLTLKGPLDSTSVPLALRTTLDGPSFWWRLTHPLELFGLTK